MKRRVHSTLFTGTLGGAAAVLAVQHAGAQEALTASRSALQAAYERDQTLQSAGYAHSSQSIHYSLGAGVSFEFNDNVNLSETDPEEDFSIKPRVSGGMVWAATDYTRLGLDVSLAYSHYFNESRRGGLDFNVSPTADNNIGFEILVGDWHISIYDSFSVRTDPIRDGTVAGQDEIAEFDNTIGAVAYYILDNSRLNGGYAFKTSLFEDSDFSDSERNSHLFHAGYQYSFNPAFTLGVNASASMSVYNSGNQNDNTVYTVGPTIQWAPTEFITVSGGGGPALVTYRANNAGFKPENRESYYLYSTINHRFSEFASHALSVNQTVAPATQVSDRESLVFNYTIDLDIIRDTSLTIGAFYEIGESFSGRTGVRTSESYDRMGGRIGIGRRFGENLSAHLNYRHTTRDSETVNRDYSQNRVTLSVSYRF